MWTQGLVLCRSCEHSWRAVRPVGAEILECPNCGEMKGATRDEVVEFNLDKITDHPFVPSLDNDQCGYHVFAHGAKRCCGFPPESHMWRIPRELYEAGLADRRISKEHVGSKPYLKPNGDISQLLVTCLRCGKPYDPMWRTGCRGCQGKTTNG